MSFSSIFSLYLSNQLPKSIKQHALTAVLTKFQKFIGNFSIYMYYFLALSNKVEKCLLFRFVCQSIRLSLCSSVYPSVHVLVFVNNIREPRNLYILFRSAKACFVLKMVKLRLLFRTQGDIKMFRYITGHGWIL